MAAVQSASPAPPPPTSPAALQKRKRPDSDESASVSSEINGLHRSSASSPIRLAQTIRDVWLILQKHTRHPALLKRISDAVPDHPQKLPVKRQKTVDDPATQSLALKVEKGVYASLDDFETDFRNAAANVASSTSANGAETPTNFAQSSGRQPSGKSLNASVDLLTKYVANLLARERQRPRRTRPNAENENEQAELTNGIKEEPTDEDFAPSDAHNVLTILGNAAGHKQLFSSLQLPTAQDEAVRVGIHSRLFDDETAPLRDEVLPHNILRTEIYAANHDEVSPETKRGQTFRDVFSAPPHLQQIQPPKPTKPILTRADRLSWLGGKRTQEASKTAGYTLEKIPTGHWLGYGGVAETQEPVSPEAKRKRRDRALSTGEAVLTPTEVTKAAQEQAKEDALFRSAYSSFAPVKDNALALISDGDKGSVWWDRSGRELFEVTVAADGPYYVEKEQSATSGGDTDAQLENVFEDAVAKFEPAEPDMPLSKAESTMEERETAEILAEISEMLETLHSHQRIRNASLSGNPKSSIGQSVGIDDLTGTPTTPSSAELTLYETLRQQLALMVSLLPPYAVAKLNGDQLAQLNISQSIPMEDTDYRGVMEEDQGSRMARSAALNAAVNASNTAPRAPPAAASSYRSPTVPAPSSTPSARPVTYGNYQPSTMPRGSSFTRQALSGWQQPTGQQYTSVQRPGYSSQAYAQTPGAASPGLATNRGTPAGRPAVPNYNGRPQMNGQAPYAARPASSSYAAAAAGFGLGSPGPRTSTPQLQQAPTPQMTRPGSSSMGYQSPAPGRPGSASASAGLGAGSPSKGVAGYPTPSASVTSGAVAAVTANGSRPQTPASGGQGQAGSVNGTPRAG